MSGASARLLPGGRRLHLQHGPIDIVAEAFGREAERVRAYEQAAARFRAILDELVAELPVLRQPVEAGRPRLEGAVARRMLDAVWPHRETFVTPMAAVAGAVADEVLAAMVRGRELARAYVNDGGDIALHLAPGERLRTAVVDRVDAPAPGDWIEVRSEEPVRGVATSGWRGRSLSLGVADAVTVTARDAASADAAATLIANAVDVDHPAIRRLPANHLRDDTDLGDLLVTVAVGDLPGPAVSRALARGAATAVSMRRKRLVWSARLALRGEVRRIGPDPRQHG